MSDTHENNTEWAALLFAVGSLWENGVAIDWDAFYAHEARRRIPLPTYVFQRQRYWVDPAPTTGAALLPASVSALPTVPETAADLATAVSDSVPDLAVAGSRKDRLATRLIELLAPVSGREPSQISTSATFLEQGFDSLSLTQVAFAIRKEFSVRLSFSQLMKEMPNVEMVAAHLDATLAPDVFAATQLGPQQAQFGLTGAQVPPLAAASSLAVQSPPVIVPQAGAMPPSTSMQEIVAEQARTISRLVDLLAEKRGTGDGRRETCVSEFPSEAGAATHREGSSQATVARLEPLSVEATVPQRGIFSSAQLSDRLSACYNESVTVRVMGTISIQKMIRAIERLAERHDALRASFDEDGAVMCIAPVQRPTVPISDLSASSNAAAQEARLWQLVAQETAKAFPLPEGPLFRSQIVLLGDRSAAVIFSGHHVICDGWSLDVLIHDFCAFYSEELSGEPARLAPAGCYADYVRGVTQRAQSEEFTEARTYWHAKFAKGFPVLVLPTDRPRLARRELASRRLDHPVDPMLVRNLRAFGTKHGCSFFAVMLGALSILLARVSRQSHFVITLPTAEQPVVGQPDLVGHCVNLLPFTVDLFKGEACSAFAARVQGELGEAQDHAAFTLVNLLEELRLVTPGSSIGAVSAGLTNVKKYRSQDLQQSGFSIDYDVNPKSFESLEWYLNALEIGDRLILRCQYDVALFEETTVAAWLRALEAILQAMVTDPSRNTWELAGIAGEQRFAQTDVLYALTSNGLIRDDVHPNASVAGEKTTEYAALGSETERKLTTIWQATLGVKEIGIRDDFFALGGHSLLAVQLFAQIEKVFGIKLPLATLFEAATIADLARVLGQDTRPSHWSPLVAIQPTGSRPPFFCMHGAGGNVLIYRALSLNLGPDQPFYGLQSQGLDGSSPPLTTIEEMAARYVKEIRRVQPRGPYFLGGYCMGGNVAFEAARQLQAMGEPIALLALFDTMNWSQIPRPSVFDKIYHSAERLRFHLGNFLSIDSAGKSEFFKGKLEALRHRLPVWRGTLVSTLRRGPRAGSSQAQLLSRIWQANDRASFAYIPGVYPGVVTDFRPMKQYRMLDRPDAKWGDLAQGGQEVVVLPVSPAGMLVEPFVRDLAVALRKRIDRAIAEEESLHGSDFRVQKLA